MTTDNAPMGVTRMASVNALPVSNATLEIWHPAWTD